MSTNIETFYLFWPYVTTAICVLAFTDVLDQISLNGVSACFTVLVILSIVLCVFTMKEYVQKILAAWYCFAPIVWPLAQPQQELLRQCHHRRRRQSQRFLLLA